MSGPPAASVVVPLHDKGPHVRRALDSVLAQTVQDFELIVVDDASTDGGGEVAAGFRDSRLRLLRRAAPGAGGHAARNAGIAAARSELVAFLDADDEWSPSFLETVLRLRREFPRAGAYSTAYEVVEPGGARAPGRLGPVPAPPWEGLLDGYFRVALDAAPVCASATAVPKSVFADVGAFPEGERRGGDVDMWLRIALSYPIAYSSAAAATYRRDAVNRIDVAGYSLERRRVIDTALAAIREGRVAEDALADLREYVAPFQLHWAASNILLGDPRAARRELRACETRRFARRKAWLTLWSFMPPALTRALWRMKNAVHGRA